MTTAIIQFVRRRTPGVHFEITQGRIRLAVHTTASAFTCLVFFGGICLALGMLP